jgi:hypothetical protein
MNFGGESDYGSDASSSVVDVSDLLRTATTTTTTTPIITQPSPQATAATATIEKANKDDKIRIVVGESILQWRRLRQNPSLKESTTSTTTTKEHAVVLQHVAETRAIPWEESNLQVSTDKTKKVVQLSTTHHHQEDDATATATAVYTAKTVRPPQSSSMKHVDAVAIWDATRHVYVLEIPQLVASDWTMDSRSSTDQTTTSTREIHDWTKNNPVTQSRQAEQSLVRTKRKQQQHQQQPSKSNTSSNKKSAKRTNNSSNQPR